MSAVAATALLASARMANAPALTSTSAPASAPAPPSDALIMASSSCGASTRASDVSENTKSIALLVSVLCTSMESDTVYWPRAARIDCSLFNSRLHSDSRSPASSCSRRRDGCCRLLPRVNSGALKALRCSTTAPNAGSSSSAASAATPPAQPRRRRDGMGMGQARAGGNGGREDWADVRSLCAGAAALRRPLCAVWQRRPNDSKSAACEKIRRVRENSPRRVAMLAAPAAPAAARRRRPLPGRRRRRGSPRRPPPSRRRPARPPSTPGRRQRAGDRAPP